MVAWEQEQRRPTCGCSPTRGRFCVGLVGCLCLRSLAALWILAIFLLGWKLPLGGPAAIVHIEIPPVLSKKWHNRDRRQDSQRLGQNLGFVASHPGTMGRRKGYNGHGMGVLVWTAI